MDIFNITDDDSTLEGDLTNMMMTYLYLVSLLRRPIATLAEVSCIHCQGEQQCMRASATPGATLSFIVELADSQTVSTCDLSVR